MKSTCTSEEAYGPAFFAGQRTGSVESARIVLGILFDLFKPNSVIDVGCGQGGWLAAAEEHGAKMLTGVDGPWVDRHHMLSRNIKFTTADLEGDLVQNSKHDLCI